MGRNTVKRCQVSIDDHALSTKDKDPALDVLDWNQPGHEPSAAPNRCAFKTANWGLARSNASRLERRLRSALGFIAGKSGYVPVSFQRTNRFSTFARAHGVLRRNVRLDFTLGSNSKQR